MRWMLAVALVAWAGCTDEAPAADASLSFDGSGDGAHSDSSTCDSDGQLTGSGMISDGSVRVTLTDDEGQSLYDQTFSGEVAVDLQAVTGHAGTWTLEARRAADDLVGGDDFRGEYTFRLDC